MSIYAVPTTKAKEFLEKNNHIICSDEAEAVSMACGEYLVTGNIGTVLMGENGFLNALDAIITLSQLHEIPVNIHVYVREDEPQHAMVAKHIKEVAQLYGINATFF